MVTPEQIQEFKTQYTKELQKIASSKLTKLVTKVEFKHSNDQWDGEFYYWVIDYTTVEGVLHAAEGKLVLLTKAEYLEVNAEKNKE